MTLKDFFVIIQLLGIAVLLFELIYITFQKPSNLQKISIILVVCCLFSFIAYYFELIAATQESAYFACILGYLSKPFVILSMLLFLAEYTNTKLKKPIIFGLLAFSILISLIVLTNDYHHLYYTSISFDATKDASGLVKERGIFWYIYMIFNFIVSAFYGYIAIKDFAKAKTKQAKKMSIYVFLMLFSGIFGLACYIFKLTKGYDTTLTGSFLGAFFLLVLLIRFHLFDALTLAKDKFLAEADSAVIILDGRNKISYYNNLAKDLIPELAKAKIYEDKIINILNSYNKDEPIKIDEKYYNLTINNLVAGKNRFNKNIGTTYILMDITEQHLYQERLQKDINIATSKLKEIQHDILISFANIIEARDGFTGVHVKNVSIYARKIAESLAKTNEKYQTLLDEDTIATIEACAPLHDVGKIFISDTILGKPCKLTKEEFDIIKTHANLGGQIIDETINQIEEPNYVRVAKEIATCHHEWWNGNGYPNHLIGEQIPLSARIMAVSDVYDALRMKRPYKDALSKEKAIEIIISETGTHFDPDVVEAFLKIKDTIEE